MLNMSGVASREQNVIDIDQKHGGMVTRVGNEERQVVVGCGKSHGEKHGAKFGETGSEGLFETINGFGEKADMIRMIRVNEARWLSHEDLFGEIPIEESIMDVKLTYWPIRGNCNGKYDADGSGSDHRAECIKVVNAFILVIAFGNQASFVTFDRSIGMTFDAKDPFTADGLLIWWRRDQGPSVIGGKGIHLKRHGIASFGLGVGLSE